MSDWAGNKFKKNSGEGAHDARCNPASDAPVSITTKGKSYVGQCWKIALNNVPKDKSPNSFHLRNGNVGTWN